MATAARQPRSRAPHIREMLRLAYAPRDARKELLKIHVWEHKTEQLVHRHGERVHAVLHPRTLSSGSESGLVNQIFALVGCTAFAALFSADLVLPDFASHDHGGTQLPFASLFEIKAFANAIRPHVTVITDAAYYQLRSASDVARHQQRRGSNTMSNTSIVSVLQGDELLGWRVYKSMQRVLFRSDNLTAAEASRLRAIEASAYRGLQIAPPIRALVEQAQQQLFGRGGYEYGCLHARIERDMIRSQEYNQAGRPPVLSDYLPLSPPEVMRSTQAVFVAVGTDVTTADARRLQQRAPWGARLALARPESKSRVRGMGNAVTDLENSYTRDALVDLAICRGASWFAGWPGSTFARLLGALQTLDHGRGYLAVCPGSVSFANPNERTLMGQHDFCVATRRSRERSPQDSLEDNNQ